MPIFYCNPDDPPFQRMLDKLTAAGWIKSSARRDRPKDLGPGGAEMVFQWTPQGRERLMQVLALFTEIEQASATITNDELPFLKMVALTAALQGGGTAGEEPPKRG
jgi:hypothetical protein